MGDIPAKANMISSVITFPQTAGQAPAADTTFDITVQVANLVAGSFTNADSTYYAGPQTLSGGKVVGHTHVTVQDMGKSMNPTQPLDATQFAFFKGINDAGNGNGLLKATVTGGLPAGNYRVCTMTSASNHQPVLMPVAQRGTPDDCTKFTIGGGGGGNAGGNAGGNGGNAGGNGANAGGNGGNAGGNAGGNGANAGGNGANAGGNGANTGGNGANTGGNGGNAGGNAGGNGANAGGNAGNNAGGNGANAGGNASSTSAAAAAATSKAATGGNGGNGGFGGNGGNNAGNGGGNGGNASSTSAAAAAATSKAATGGNGGNNAGGNGANAGGKASSISAAAPAATSAAAATGGNASGAVGGIAAPAVAASGNKDRPFEVNGNTFVNEAAAKQRACDIQNNACMNAFNSGNKAVTASACTAQQTACNAA
jgi:transcription initiation factor TFIID subunit 15